MVPPVEVFEEGELQLLDRPPRAAAEHQFGLELPDRGPDQALMLL